MNKLAKTLLAILGDETVIMLGATIIEASIKNPEKKAKLRAVMLQLYKAIKLANSGDPDFE